MDSPKKKAIYPPPPQQPPAATTVFHILSYIPSDNNYKSPALAPQETKEALYIDEPTLSLTQLRQLRSVI